MRNWQAVLTSQDESHRVNRATTAEEPKEKQISGDITRNLALGKVSSRSAPRLLSWGSSMGPVCTQAWLS